MIKHSSILGQRWELPVSFYFGAKTIFSDLSVVVRCKAHQTHDLLAEFDQLIQLKAASMGYDVKKIEADAIVVEGSSDSLKIWEFEFIYQVIRAQSELVCESQDYLNQENFNTHENMAVGTGWLQPFTVLMQKFSSHSN
ncbi:MAG: hypothetical protein WBA57_26585 [Elainellaceae cyanobacterium]